MGVFNKHYNAHGAILTGDEIYYRVATKKIVISPFIKEHLNPNSYNIRIGNQFMMYDNIDVVDLNNPDTYKRLRKYDIPTDGVILRPGNLYLVPTLETFGSCHYVPLITGRSSMGRLGISVHNEAGFGDIGYIGKWVLQLKVTYPTRIYPGLQMAQVYFMPPMGDYKKCYGDPCYNSHYTNGEIGSQFNVSK